MTATAEPIATVQDLQKRYGPLEAVRGLSFDLQPGEIFGLLGPNGAGKTTTVEIMEGLRVYDGGSVRVLGFDPWKQARALKERIGAALQNTILPDKIFPREALAHYAGFYSHPAPVDGLLSRFGLTESETRPTTPSLAGRNSASRLPWRWSTIPTWCFWTNRRRGSMPRCGAICTTSSPAYAPTARPFCLPPTTLRRRSVSATAWPLLPRAC